MKEIKITENEAQQRLDRFLRKYLSDYKLGDIYKLFRNKKVKVNHKREKENYMLQLDDIVQLYVSDAVQGASKAAVIPAKPIDIVYEDENLLLVNKPFGLLTHPDSPVDHDTLIDRALYYISQQEGYVPSPTFTPSTCNRLDRNTGGIVIVAKNYKALKSANKLVRERGIKKLYLCVVKGVIREAGEVKNFLLKDEANNKVEILEAQEEGAKGVHTKYRPMASNNEYTLMEVELITGRPHQIRAHFASIGHPIVGDVKYGDKNINKIFLDRFKLKHQFLYAYKLVFKAEEEGLEYLKGSSFTSKLPAAFDSITQQLFD
ncbi:MAG TPA: RluA family pseudouridine synthase [Patescibacteria group bacterium]|nr:RluA family pseudouridine synthase [Patescibacteria group bacterium]